MTISYTPEDLLVRIVRWMLIGGAAWLVYMGWKLRAEQSAAMTALGLAAFVLVVWAVLFWIDILDMKGVKDLV